MIISVSIVRKNISNIIFRIVFFFKCLQTKLFYIQCRSCEFFSGVKRRIKKFNAWDIYVQISRIYEKIHHVQGRRPSIKCAHRGKGFILTKGRTHMDYFFPIGNEHLSSSQHYAHFILPFEFWISIYNNKNCPIWDNFR